MNNHNLSNLTIKSNYCTINNDDLLFNIDNGSVTSFGQIYDLTLESTGIIVNNMFINFQTELFQIYRSQVHFRGIMHMLNLNFMLNVTRGRIFINNECHLFTITNNMMIIDPNPTNETNRAPINRRRININRPRQVNNQTRVNNQQNLAAISADRQNTHNTKILDNLYNILVVIKSNTDVKLNLSSSVQEIRNLINQNHSSNISKGNHILDHITTQFGYIDRFQMYETDVLLLIWNAIRHDINLQSIFYENLLSMYEHNNIVCLTGRVSRLIDVFSGIINIKPDMTKIRSEMMSKCIKIRNNIETTDETELKEAIRKQLYIDYVESNILSKSDLDNELNEWINDI